MPKAKMKFPEIPGDTPREKFINLVRSVLSSGRIISVREEDAKQSKHREQKQDSK
jgi:hypothetical protein